MKLYFFISIFLSFTADAQSLYPNGLYRGYASCLHGLQPYALHNRADGAFTDLKGKDALALMGVKSGKTGFYLLAEDKNNGMPPAAFYALPSPTTIEKDGTNHYDVEVQPFGGWQVRSKPLDKSADLMPFAADWIYNTDAHKPNFKRRPNLVGQRVPDAEGDQVINSEILRVAKIDVEHMADYNADMFKKQKIEPSQRSSQAKFNALVVLAALNDCTKEVSDPKVKAELSEQMAKLKQKFSISNSEEHDGLPAESSHD